MYPLRVFLKGECYNRVKRVRKLDRATKITFIIICLLEVRYNIMTAMSRSKYWGFTITEYIYLSTDLCYKRSLFIIYLFKSLKDFYLDLN